jgi:hypothetical protein
MSSSRVTPRRRSSALVLTLSEERMLRHYRALPPERRVVVRRFIAECARVFRLVLPSVVMHQVLFAALLA